jgi:thioredoxin reductase (NADPH)
MGAPVQHSVIIVGAGPAGLTAAIYCSRAGLLPLVAAGAVKGTAPGGQLMTTTDVENYPGFPEGISGPELIAKMTEQAKRFGATIEDVVVKEVDTSSRPFRVVFENGSECVASSIILATGASARWLGIVGEEKFVNKGISACATCDGPLKAFRNKHIFVVGGGDSAMEEALFLTKFASNVSIVHRKNSFRASKIMVQQILEHPKIDVLWNTVVSGYEGTDFLSGIKVVTNGDAETRTIPAAGLFIAIGHDPNTEFLDGSGVELTAGGYVSVHDHVFTSVDGIFATGDVHDSHFRQAVSAAGFGCMGAIACERWLSENNSETSSL